MTDQELKQAVSKRVKLELAPQVAGGPIRIGRVIGVLDAADGMLVTFAPDDAPGKHVTYHAHYILALHPA